MAAVAMGVAGAAIGFYAGGPTGAALGWSIGYGVGTIAFPEKQNVPRPDEIRFRAAGYGNFKPYIWGTMRVAGIPIDGPPKLTAHEGSAGGKGGPSEPTPTTYSIDFLREFFCVSRGTHQVLALFFNKRLVGDYRDGATVSGELPVTFYDGAADQSADPTEEAFYGVGNVTAYRNRLTCVFDGLNLGDVGNMPPNVEALVAKGAAHTDKPLELVTYNNNDDSPAGHEFSTGSQTGRPAITAWPEDGTSPIKIRDVNVTPKHLYTYDQETLAYIASASGTLEPWPDDVTSSGDWHYLGIGYYNGTALWGKMGDRRVNGQKYWDPTNFAPPISSTLPTSAVDWDGTDVLLAAGCTASDVVRACMLSQDGLALFVFVATGVPVSIVAPLTINKWYKIVDWVVADTGTVDGFDSTICGSSSIQFSFFAAMFENDYRHCWICKGNVNDVFVYWIDDDNVFRFASAHTVPEPSEASLPGALDLPGDTGTTSIYALASGCKAGIVCGKSLYLVERCTLTVGQQRLSEVVADIHELEGDPASRYDVTELIDIVRGFGILQQMPGRAAIEALAPIFSFGFREHYDGTRMVVQYIKRGKPSIGTFLDDDLCANDENGSNPPSPLRIIKGVDTEIPCAIYLKFIDPALDYQMNVVPWRRQDTLSTLVTTMETAVVLTKEEATRIVNMLGQNAINEADTYIWFSTRKYIKYEPEDVVTVKGYDLRIQTKHDDMATGVIKWTGVRSHPGVIVQTGAGGGDSETFEPQEIPQPQETELVIGDWPWITDESRQRVIQPAMQGALRRSWKGAVLYESRDGGTNYNALLTDNEPATIGECLTALGNFGGGKVFDEGPPLRIAIGPGGGDLSSYTRRAVFGGAGYLMVGAEMIQYKNAELIDVEDDGTKIYDVSGRLRGRHGTEWAMRGHAIGDIVVVLPTPLTVDALPSNYGFTRYYKAVTLGRTLATATAYPFRSNGVSLAPYSPVQLAAGFVGDPGSADVAMQWRRRTRLGRGWVNARSPTGQDSMPLGEASESYRVRIWADGTFQTVKRTETVTTRTFLYTEAMQTADFGGDLSVLPSWSVAQIGELGPGYETYSNGNGVSLPLFVPTGSDGYVPPHPPLDSDRVQYSVFATPAVRIYTSGTPGGSFPVNNIWIIEFNSGPLDTPDDNLARIGGGEYAGEPVPRFAVLSSIPGDFGPQAWPGATQSGFTVTVPFAIGAGYNFDFYPILTPNTTYYLNIKNAPTAYDDVPMYCDLYLPD